MRRSVIALLVRVLRPVVIAAALSLLILLPTDQFPGRVPTRIPTAFADPSGATQAYPPNHNFERGPEQVGDGPSNYDFSSGDSGWYKLGNVTFSNGHAIFSGSGFLRSSSYTLSSSTQAVKIKYKMGGTATVGVQVNGSYQGTDNLNCYADCPANGEWVEKYIGVYDAAAGQSAKVVISTTSSQSAELDEFGTQWISFSQWRGPLSPATGIQSQPKLDGGNHFAEVRNSLFTVDFDLIQNRLEFKYSFPLSGSNALVASLYRSSDNQLLSQKTLSGGSVGWTTATWSWASDYVGETVYVKFSSTGLISWIDDVGQNLVDAHNNDPSADGGDPVDTSTGAYSHSNTDMFVPGKGIPLEFTRFYNSMSVRSGDLGYNWTHTYSTSLRIDSDNSVMVYYGRGGGEFFKYNAGSYTPPGDVQDALVKNGDGSYTLTKTSQIEYNFTSAGKLSSIVDRNGNTTTVSYDGNGYLSEVEDAGGRTLAFTPDANGRIVEIEDPLGRTVGFEYDSNGDLTEVTDVKGGITTYTYSNDRMTSLTDSNDNLQNENIFDNANRVVEQTTQTGGTNCFYYGSGPSYTSDDCTGVSPAPSAGQTVLVDPLGNKTTYDFDTKFRTSSITDDDGGVTSFAYDSDNNPTCITDPLGNKTGYEYDSAGNVIEIVDAANTDANCALAQGGVSTQFTYTSNNDPETVTDPLGRETAYVYDANGDLTRVAHMDDASNVLLLTCVEYDTAGLATAVVESTNLTVPQDPDDPCTGNRTEFGYDDYGDVTSIVDPRFSGQQTPPTKSFTYDLGGRMLTVVNELDHTVTYTYDDQNKLLTATDELGNVTTRTYDQKGNLETVIDANRAVEGTAESGAACGDAGTGDGDDDDSDTVVDDGCPNLIYNYDEADRLIGVVDALGNSTTYGYDAVGNRVSVTNANRQPVNTVESGAACGTAGTGDGDDDDSDSVIDDGCPSARFAYDALNRLESSIDALGRTSTYEYDAASNIAGRTDARGLLTVYVPDELNRVETIEHWDGQTLVDDVDFTYNEVGQRTQMVDATGTTTYGYDDLNRILDVTFAGSNVVSYSYDNVGNRDRITYPDSKYVDYTYDEARRMETVTDWLDNETAYTYNDAGMLTKTELPNGVWTDYGFDDADRLSSVVNKKAGPTTISSFTYTLDASGNRTQMVDLSGTHSYEYDALYRLTEVTYPGPETDPYTYDAVGNRLTKNTDDYTYDAADQLTDLEGVTFNYDDNGNQTARGNDTFEYDHENRLVGSVIDSVTSTSEYNGDGLRMSHTVDTTTTDYFWDIARSLPVVLQDGTNTYVYGIDLISAADGSGDVTYFTYDGLGSTTDVTDESADTVATYSYDVFGAIRSQTGSSGNFWLFTGEQQDSDSELYYLRARYYDPASGRFLGRDPIPGTIFDPRTQSPYGYGMNNPCRLSDPSGLSATTPSQRVSSTMTCSFSGKVEGIGAYNFPENPIPGFPDACDWLNICPKIYPDDLLFKFEGSVEFTFFDDGSWSVSVKLQQETHNNWYEAGWETATEGDAFGIKLDYAGGPFDLDASVFLLFDVSAEGIQASSLIDYGPNWKANPLTTVLTETVDITCP